MNNESDQIQIKVLKTEIKEVKLKINNLFSFNRQVKDLTEFVEIFNKTFATYKPKKKEQKEIYEKIYQILNNFCQSL